MMKSFTLNIKVVALLDITRNAETLEEAIAEGGKLCWNDIKAKGTSLTDGHFDVIGVSSNEDWDVSA